MSSDPSVFELFPFETLNEQTLNQTTTSAPTTPLPLSVPQDNNIMEAPLASNMLPSVFLMQSPFGTPTTTNTTNTNTTNTNTTPTETETIQRRQQQQQQQQLPLTSPTLFESLSQLPSETSSLLPLFMRDVANTYQQQFRRQNEQVLRQHEQVMQLLEMSPLDINYNSDSNTNINNSNNNNNNVTQCAPFTMPNYSFDFVDDTYETPPPAMFVLQEEEEEEEEQQQHQDRQQQQQPQHQHVANVIEPFMATNDLSGELSPLQKWRKLGQLLDTVEALYMERDFIKAFNVKLIELQRRRQRYFRELPIAANETRAALRERFASAFLCLETIVRTDADALHILDDLLMACVTKQNKLIWHSFENRVAFRAMFDRFACAERNGRIRRRIYNEFKMFSYIREQIYHMQYDISYKAINRRHYQRKLDHIRGMTVRLIKLKQLPWATCSSFLQTRFELFVQLRRTIEEDLSALLCILMNMQIEIDATENAERKRHCRQLVELRIVAAPNYKVLTLNGVKPTVTSFNAQRPKVKSKATVLTAEDNREIRENFFKFYRMYNGHTTFGDWSDDADSSAETTSLNNAESPLGGDTVVATPPAVLAPPAAFTPSSIPTSILGSAPPSTTRTVRYYDDPSRGNRAPRVRSNRLSASSAIPVSTYRSSVRPPSYTPTRPNRGFRSFCPN